MTTKRINEDFLDTVDTSDMTQQDVKVTAEEERLTPQQWNSKYVHDYTHMIVLFRVMPDLNAARDIPRVKALFEKVLDMYYPDHAPIQVIYTHDNVYKNVYEKGGAQKEECGRGISFLADTDYKNSVRFKTAVNTYDTRNEVRNFLNFAVVMNKLSYKTVGSQTQGGHVEVYLSNGEGDWERPGGVASFSDIFLNREYEEVFKMDSQGAFKYSTLDGLIEDLDVKMIGGHVAEIKEEVYAWYDDIYKAKNKISD